jgi:hypothetical protein
MGDFIRFSAFNSPFLTWCGITRDGKRAAAAAAVQLCCSQRMCVAILTVWHVVPSLLPASHARPFNML